MRTETTSALEASLEVRAVFGRLRRRLRELSVDDALTPSQASVLARLAKGDVGLATASSLAAIEGVRPQSMAAVLAALEQAGLIRRVPDPDDGRRSLVELTDAGRGRHRGDQLARGEWLARVMDERMTPEERRTVVDAMAILDRVVRA